MKVQLRAEPDGLRVTTDPDVTIATRDCTASNHAALALGLLPAMTRGEPLEVDEVDPTFLSNVRQIQAIYANMFELRPTEIRATTRPESFPPNRRVACFFSGGLDSFYTVLSQPDDIEVLIHVHGFARGYSSPAKEQHFAERFRAVARALGKELVEVQTNARDLADTTGLKWGWNQGAVLAAIAHVLSHRFAKFFIAAGASYSQLGPWGSHPAIDPLWGTAGLTFVHHGADANRLDKTRFLAQHPLVLENLYVCVNRGHSALENCGRCYKCVRTMIELRTVGALSRCSTFASELDLKRLTSMRLRNTESLRYLPSCLRALEREDRDPELQRALRSVLRPSTARQAIRWVRSVVRPPVA